ncbi:MAG: DUF4252 domain-containing protein [Flavobacteriaceae bacterium]|nr:DUF4252 domain-containing protein [Flavobacteriaceae bacterium]
MKTIYTLIVLIFAPFLVSSQSVFDEFENDDEVMSVVVTQKAFKLMSRFAPKGDKETMEYFEVIDQLNDLKVYVTKNTKTSDKMKLVAEKYISSKKLVQLMRMKEDKKNVMIYVKEGVNDDYVEELLMFIWNKGDGSQRQGIIVSLTGNIDLNKISALTSHMNIPGSEYLNNAKKNK